jgi:hypothetical protein
MGSDFVFLSVRNKNKKPKSGGKDPADDENLECVGTAWFLVAWIGAIDLGSNPTGPLSRSDREVSGL